MPYVCAECSDKTVINTLQCTDMPASGCGHVQTLKVFHGINVRVCTSSGFLASPAQLSRGSR